MAKKELTEEEKQIKETEKTFTGFCSRCHRTCQILHKTTAKARIRGILPSSRKDKARVAQQTCRDLILQYCGLPVGDVKSVSMGETGADILLSEKAREVFPFHAIEVTAAPNVSVWAKFAQAVRHGENQIAGRAAGNGRPILVFKRNGTELFAMVRFEDLLQVLFGGEKCEEP